MKSKLLLVLACALSVGAVTSSAQGTAATTAPASGYSWKVTPALVSQYIFRGVRLGGLSFQPSVELTSGPITGGIWLNAPVDDRIPGQSDPEIDFYGSYSIQATKDLTIVPGATIYTYPRADDDRGYYSVTVEPNIAFNYTIENVVITPKFYYDTVLKGFTTEVSGAISIPLARFGTELALSGTVGTYKWKEAVENSIPEVKNGGDYWILGINVPFAIGTNGKLNLGYAYHQGRNNYFTNGGPRVKNTAATGNDVVSASYTLSF